VSRLFRRRGRHRLDEDDEGGGGLGMRTMKHTPDDDDEALDTPQQFARLMAELESELASLLAQPQQPPPRGRLESARLKLLRAYERAYWSARRRGDGT
jgi:hypothetical protein